LHYLEAGAARRRSALSEKRGAGSWAGRREECCFPRHLPPPPAAALLNIFLGIIAPHQSAIIRDQIIKYNNNEIESFQKAVVFAEE